MIKKYVLFFIILFFFAINADASNSVKIHVKVNKGILHYHHDLSIKEVSQLCKKPAWGCNRYQTFSLFPKIQYKTTQYFKQKCYHISAINFEYGLKQSDIYIAKEFAKNSCRYNAIKKHEEEHYKVNLYAYIFFKSQLQKEIKKIVSRIQPFCVPKNTPQSEQAIFYHKQAINNYIKQSITPFLTFLNNKQKEKHEKIVHNPLIKPYEFSHCPAMDRQTKKLVYSILKDKKKK